ncbi:hypothetical protein ACFQY4_09260 [Catellatospora bangladeshensis]|uniref:Uncharacterized protein n=1 Tax=Catellatospora bangladeshensis TaxID=310355 RepID=A0A8J3J816_9ACTN|nr:hypothetical protein [Catellatospora bangladeshensis]GIF79026.1 hypothetical protein Cba03nite_03750 [Catellatospora bangladeshensis]
MLELPERRPARLLLGLGAGIAAISLLGAPAAKPAPTSDKTSASAAAGSEGPSRRDQRRPSGDDSTTDDIAEIPAATTDEDDAEAGDATAD